MSCVFFEALKPTDRLCDFVTDGQELTALVVASVAGDFFCQVGGLGAVAGEKGIPWKSIWIGNSRESSLQMDHPKDQPRFVWSTWTSCGLIGERIEVCESGW